MWPKVSSFINALGLLATNDCLFHKANQPRSKASYSKLEDLARRVLNELQNQQMDPLLATIHHGMTETEAIPLTLRTAPKASTTPKSDDRPNPVVSKSPARLVSNPSGSILPSLNNEGGHFPLSLALWRTLTMVMIYFGADIFGFIFDI